jgi:nucleoside 2-deoxyribosyltransferase
MPSTFSQMIAHATGGRRYSFAIMSYHEGYSFFERIKQIVSEETGLECLRADDIPNPGDNLREKIHAAIDNAVFVMADVSEPRPNIYYEIGYAIARNKPLLILARDQVELETDLVGIELVRYTDNRDGFRRFEADFRRQLAIHKDSNVSLQRSMIVPPEPVPSYIVLNPKKPQPNSRFKHHPRERRTYGDYLGLVGVLNGFASVYGEQFAPELVSASHAADDLVEWDANLFLIGATKTNRFTGMFLKLMQGAGATAWRFAPCAGENAEGDYQVQLIGESNSGSFATPCGEYDLEGERQDFGLIVRGPHPRHPRRTVTIMAGPHSLGTGAACLAATKSKLVREISKRFAGVIDLTARNRTFWVLVKGKPGADDHLDAENVSIIDGGVCSKGT